jgi:hypothetical protein
MLPARQQVQRAAVVQERSLPVVTSVATVLSGSWRNEVAPLADLDDAAVTPAIRGGAGALLGRRVTTDTRVSDIARATLRDLLRHQVIEAARFERGLELRLSALAEIGIRPIVIKGWSIARRYPRKGLRHYSDLDLVITARDRQRTEEVLARFEDDRVPVDLHVGLPHVGGRDPAALAARLRPIAIGGAEAVTLGDEDHLWLLALHALGHGAWRPVWLCDLALLVEQRGASLDWDYVFLGAQQDRRAVEVALTMTQLLGADLSGTPIGSFEPPPRWVDPALQASWNEGYRAYAPLTSLPAPRELWSELRRRWPDPIRATTAAHGPWNEWPRAPLQLLDSARRALRFAVSRDRVAGIWRR